MSEILIGIAGIVVSAVLSVVLWKLEQRRKSKEVQRGPTGILAVVHGLSPLELTLLRRVAQASTEFARLEERHPTNHPLNTAEASEAKARVYAQLTEDELMKAIGVHLTSTFTAAALNLERHRLVDYEDVDEFSVRMLWITDLGVAAINAAGI